MSDDTTNSDKKATAKKLKLMLSEVFSDDAGQPEMMGVALADSDADAEYLVEYQHTAEDEGTLEANIRRAITSTAACVGLLTPIPSRVDVRAHSPDAEQPILYTLTRRNATRATGLLNDHDPEVAADIHRDVAERAERFPGYTVVDE